VANLSRYGPVNSHYQASVEEVDHEMHQGLRILKTEKGLIDSYIASIATAKSRTDRTSAAPAAEKLTYTYDENSQVFTFLFPPIPEMRIRQNWPSEDFPQWSKMERELRETTNHFRDNLTAVTREARRTIASDPVSTSRRWMIGEVLALMLVNVLLVLGLIKSLGAETRRRIWRSADTDF
jgi:hypothetical protein